MRDVFVRELSPSSFSFWRFSASGERKIHTPVPVKLREHSEPSCQLWREERDPLTWRDVPPRKRTRLGALFCGGSRYLYYSVRREEEKKEKKRK